MPDRLPGHGPGPVRYHRRVAAPAGGNVGVNARGLCSAVSPSFQTHQLDRLICGRSPNSHDTGAGVARPAPHGGGALPDDLRGVM